MKEIGNGQYHASTIAGSESLQKKIQRGIDHVNREHEHVLYVIKGSLKDKFDFPRDGNDIRIWGRLRGMDLHDQWVDSDDIAVCLIGAQHPDMRKLVHVTRALGETDADPDSGYYETRTVEVDGESAEVETKVYPGLLGEQFKSAREDEIVQAPHRVRPILSDEPIHVYKFTTVPTRLPVDERLTWDEFLYSGLSHKAIKEFVTPICTAFDDDHVETTTSEIYRVVEANDGSAKRSARRWAKTLADEGISEFDGVASDSSRQIIIDMAELRKIA